MEKKKTSFTRELYLKQALVSNVELFFHKFAKYFLPVEIWNGGTESASYFCFIRKPGQCWVRLLVFDNLSLKFANNSKRNKRIWLQHFTFCEADAYITFTGGLMTSRVGGRQEILGISTQLSFTCVNIRWRCIPVITMFKYASLFPRCLSHIVIYT